MSIFSSYRAYLKDNPEGYWFKRKLYGWGWTPARWQGWAVLGGYLVAVLVMALWVEYTVVPNEAAPRAIALPFAILTLLLLLTCYVKGESPHWQWGPEKPEADNRP
ncbi:hypothetical protein K2Q16_03705 [Patescibacteria group bacterium]|nr:hypothetical protein [Patescibacteria group bacterium]